MQKIFFQSSLPRAGSTLLQNILGQNPDFYVTPTSGVLELMYGARGNFTNDPTFKTQDPELMKKAWAGFCNAGMHGYFNELTDRLYIVDKSRGWGINYGFLNSFYPNPKIVCVVRDLRSIYCSMEKKFRENQHKDSGIVNWKDLKGTTTRKRVETWAQGHPVGIAVERLEQILREGIGEKMLFIRYEDLAKYPQDTLDAIYEFYEVPNYIHDFDNIEQITQEDDNVYGIYGDHIIRKKLFIIPEDYEKILGPDVSEGIKKTYPWFYSTFKY